jgi:hypothetical protein
MGTSWIYQLINHTIRKNIMTSNSKEITQQIEQSTKPPATADMLFSDGMLERVEKFAGLMAQGRSTIPDHLRGSEADCMAVVMQAAQWKMNPFAVAQKTHLVSGTLGYEAQLVNAVINSMAPTKDRLHYDWFGPWENVVGKFETRTSQKGRDYIAPNWTLDDEKDCGVKVWATLKGEDEPRELKLLLSQAQVRNSTLWASDPKQQLAYLAVKRWSRLYCPDVIMGVYTPDELEDLPPQPSEVDITPPAEDLNSALRGEVVDAEIVTAEEMIVAINAANNGPALKAAIADVELLSDDEKEKVRAAYQAKVESVKSSQAKESHINYAEVADQIQKAQNMDDLDLARSLIGEVANEVHRKQLMQIADEKATSLQNFFGGKQ